MPSSVISRFHTTRRIEFADTDMGGIVHFSRFFVFMETAEHELLRALGFEVHMDFEGRQIGWPRVDARCRYIKPARLGDVLDIVVRVSRKGKSSMTYDFDFLIDGESVAQGQTTSVCCVMDDPSGLRPTPIPPLIADRLSAESE